MVALASRHLYVVDVDVEHLTGPEPELSGPDEMYVPTTQIRLRPDPNDPWHRRGPIATETACGETYSAAAVREYQLTGVLCPLCFTPRERGLALLVLVWLALHPEILE